MRKSMGLGGWALLAAIVAGCGAQPGKTMMTFNRGGTPPPMQTATKAGEFALYPNNSPNAITRYELERGDRYGFVKNPGGDVAAAVEISGKEQQIPLPGGISTAYYWKKVDAEK